MKLDCVFECGMTFIIDGLISWLKCVCSAKTSLNQVEMSTRRRGERETGHMLCLVELMLWCWRTAPPLSTRFIVTHQAFTQIVPFNGKGRQTRWTLQNGGGYAKTGTGVWILISSGQASEKGLTLVCCRFWSWLRTILCNKLVKKI